MSEKNKNFISIDELKLLVHKASGYKIQISDNDPILTTVYINREVLGAALGEAAELQQKAIDAIERLPGAAEKEMKRASDAAIASLSTQVGKIAKEIAGDSAAAERHNAFTKAASISVGAVILIGAFFGVSGYYLGEYSAKKKIDEAQAKVTAAEEDVENIRKTAGWAGTKEGKLAKAFFENGWGEKVATCNSPSWKIENVEKDGKPYKQCVLKAPPLFGDAPKVGWFIP
ncbi:MAG: hypothetical protein PHV02_08160 [Rhodocyclaceae bacterium]|nr:hypothetical protein [Rhodocyclaceae bacterium]